MSSKFLVTLMFLVALSRAYTVDPPTTAPSDTIQDCTNWVVVTSTDTCSAIASSNGLTLDQFDTYSENPSVASSCVLIPGDSYCIEENWGIPPTTTTTTTSSTGDGVTTPTPIQTGMISTCNKFYLVVSGDGCSDIAASNSVSLADFYAWNPAVGNTCTHLIADDYVCVGVISSTSITTATATTTGDGVTTPTPIQTGMISTCNRFYLVVSGDGCSDIAASNSVSLADFYAWNPAVGNTCTHLIADDYVCVGVIGGTTITTTTTPPTTTTPADGITTPTPYQSGMATNCNSFHLVVTGDQCGTIASAAGVSLADFYAWNPAVGSTCATLDVGDYVCIDIIGVTPVTTTTTTTTTPSATTPANGIATPTPYQTGMVENCNKFHLVVTGDQCGTIASAAGISLANFYAWNPAVGSTCATLDLGDYVCIGTLTCTSASVLTAPTQYSSTCGPIGYSHDSPTSLLIISYTSGPYIASAAACGTECLATPNCTNLYFIEGSYCNLHQGTSTFEVSSGGYQWFEASCFSSGEACGSYGFSHDATSTLIKGYTSGSSQVASAAACGAECFSTSTCTNVYFIEGSNCNLHYGAFSFAESTSSGYYSWYPLDCFVCSAST